VALGGTGVGGTGVGGGVAAGLQLANSKTNAIPDKTVNALRIIAFSS